MLVMTVLFLLLPLLPVYAADIPEPTSAFYVNDFSGVLSEQSRTYIVETNVQLRGRTGAQVVVVTMETLSGSDLNTFATDLFRHYGIGDATKNNGVLLLVVTGDRDLRLEVGYGLEGAINDAKAGRILDEYVVPYLAENKWDEGIVNGFNAIMQEVRTEYGIEAGVISSNDPVHYKKAAPSDSDSVSSSNALFAAMGVGLVFGLITGAIFHGKAAFIVNLLWLGVTFIYFLNNYSTFSAFVSLLASGLWQLVGFAITTPDVSGGSYSSSSYSSYSGSRSSSSGYSSSGSHSGGGGRSGGGGASRKF